MRHNGENVPQTLISGTIEYDGKQWDNLKVDMEKHPYMSKIDKWGFTDVWVDTLHPREKAA